MNHDHVYRVPRDHTANFPLFFSQNQHSLHLKLQLIICPNLKYTYLFLAYNCPDVLLTDLKRSPYFTPLLITFNIYIYNIKNKET